MMPSGQDDYRYNPASNSIVYSGHDENLLSREEDFHYRLSILPVKKWEAYCSCHAGKFVHLQIILPFQLFIGK